MHEINVPYKGVSKQFEFWCRPLWDWLTNLLEDPHLALYFEWDAKRFPKFDGQTWQPFVYEPWTAERFWTVQVGNLYYALCGLMNFENSKVRTTSWCTAIMYYTVCR